MKKLILLLALAACEPSNSPTNREACLKQCAPYSAVIPTDVVGSHGSSPCSCIYPQPEPEKCR